MSTAKQAGVDNYTLFQNASYKGLYNMYNFQLAEKRGVLVTSLLDHMGRVELAAKSLQSALTEEKIKNENIKGQKGLESANKEVGKEVREVVKRTAGVYPEELPVEPKLTEITKEFKKARKEVKKEDKERKNERKKEKLNKLYSERREGIFLVICKLDFLMLVERNKSSYVHSLADMVEANGAKVHDYKRRGK